MSQDAGPPDGGSADRPLVLGVAGGSGSGKSTVVRKVIERMPGIPVRLLHHDSYYRDHPALYAPCMFSTWNPAGGTPT
ncbi:MAG: hypothetical protein ACR2GQ_11220 [Gemmatimonadota bacterium]